MIINIVVLNINTKFEEKVKVELENIKEILNKFKMEPRLIESSKPYLKLFDFFEQLASGKFYDDDSGVNAQYVPIEQLDSINRYHLPLEGVDIENPLIILKRIKEDHIHLNWILLHEIGHYLGDQIYGEKNLQLQVVFKLINSKISPKLQVDFKQFRERFNVENISGIFSETIANKFEFENVDDKEELTAYWKEGQEKEYFKSFDALDNCDKSIRLGNLFVFEKITGTKMIELEKYEIDTRIKSLGEKIGQSILNVDIPNFIYYMILACLGDGSEEITLYASGIKKIFSEAL